MDVSIYCKRSGEVQQRFQAVSSSQESEAYFYRMSALEIKSHKEAQNDFTQGRKEKSKGAVKNSLCAFAKTLRLCVKSFRA